MLLTDAEKIQYRDWALYGVEESLNKKNHNTTTITRMDIQYISLDDSVTEDNLCRRIFNESGSTMNTVYLMDISQNNLVAKHIARKMGIPTLRTSSSASFSTPQQENGGWRNLNEIEKNFLISVLTPEAVIVHLIKDISTEFGYKSIVVIYDQTFKSAFNGYKIKNIRLEAIYWPSLSDEESISDTFSQVRRNTFSLNIFVLGKTSTLNQVLAAVSCKIQTQKKNTW